LNNNKAAGYDQFVNEYLKVSNQRLLSIYCNIFNIVFNSGVIPESWSIGIIQPIYKNKEDPMGPDNYKAITLVSCLGKLFTAIINNRFSLLADEINLISECQTGFRKGYSTIDNIFSIHALTSLYFSLSKKLLCSFIDFRKAFDTVRRKGLWQKLLKFGIHGKCFDIIKNMHKNIQSCVRSQKRFSDYFPCLTAVRQGEKPFPYLVFTISE